MTLYIAPSHKTYDIEMAGVSYYNSKHVLWINLKINKNSVVVKQNKNNFSDI